MRPSITSLLSICYPYFSSNTSENWRQALPANLLLLWRKVTSAVSENYKRSSFERDFSSMMRPVRQFHPHQFVRFAYFDIHSLIRPTYFCSYLAASSADSLLLWAIRKLYLNDQSEQQFFQSTSSTFRLNDSSWSLSCSTCSFFLKILRSESANSSCSLPQQTVNQSLKSQTWQFLESQLNRQSIKSASDLQISSFAAIVSLYQPNSFFLYVQTWYSFGFSLSRQLAKWISSTMSLILCYWEKQYLLLSISAQQLVVLSFNIRAVSKQPLCETSSALRSARKYAQYLESGQQTRIHCCGGTTVKKAFSGICESLLVSRSCQSSWSISWVRLEMLKEQGSVLSDSIYNNKTRTPLSLQTQQSLLVWTHQRIIFLKDF